ncbi:MAG: cytochrome c [Rhodocyclaceae bacterium]|nr:cytochrome c [Rhodocyclaceae bacterium]
MNPALLGLVLLVSTANAAAASATPPPPGARLYSEKTCNACHGPEGRKPQMPMYPKLAGQNAAYLEQQMRDIKSGTRSNGHSAAMKGVMHAVSDAEIRVLAEYLAQLKP